MAVVSSDPPSRISGMTRLLSTSTNLQAQRLRGREKRKIVSAVWALKASSDRGSCTTSKKRWRLKLEAEGKTKPRPMTRLSCVRNARSRINPDVTADTKVVVSVHVVSAAIHPAVACKNYIRTSEAATLGFACPVSVLDFHTR